jgi:hypothetical protein
MTEEQIRSLIAAYRTERLGYVARGLDDRVRQVDEQIEILGGSVPANQAQATRRPRGAGRETR